jgi:hypothetical protein
MAVAVRSARRDEVGGMRRRRRRCRRRMSEIEFLP